MSDGRLIECKSWDVISSINKIPQGELSNQLANYFKTENFEMWFDFARFKDYPDYAQFSQAEALALIKQRYKALFEKDNYSIFEKIKGTYLESKTISTISDFQLEVQNINGKLYDFIKIK